jgi:hypothetical protein
VTAFTRRSLLGALGALLAAPLAVFRRREPVTIIKGSSMGKTENLFSLADLDHMIEAAKNLNPPIQPDNGYYHLAIHPKTQKRLEETYGDEWVDVLLANGVQVVAYKRVS